MSTLPPSIPPVIQTAQPAKGKGMAITSMVFGILSYLGLGFLLFIPGLILGIVSLATKRPGKGMAIAGVVLNGAFLLVAPLLMVSMLLPALTRAREMAKRVMCQNNMNAISKGVILYEAEHQDAVPATLETLLKDGSVNKGLLHCPATAKDDSVSYRYFPRPVVPGKAETMILLTEPASDHHEGRNVAFFSGRVEWCPPQEFDRLLSLPENRAVAQAMTKN